MSFIIRREETVTKGTLQYLASSKWRHCGLRPLSSYPSTCVESIWRAQWGPQGFESMGVGPRVFQDPNWLADKRRKEDLPRQGHRKLGEWMSTQCPVVLYKEAWFSSDHLLSVFPLVSSKDSGKVESNKWIPKFQLTTPKYQNNQAVLSFPFMMRTFSSSRKPAWTIHSMGSRSLHAAQENARTWCSCCLQTPGTHQSSLHSHEFDYISSHQAVLVLLSLFHF